MITPETTSASILIKNINKNLINYFYIKMESLGPNIFPAQPGQLPPEAYQSQTPTVRTLPPKVVKNTLPPQYKTQTLPPKVVTTRLQPIFPPGSEQSSFPQY